MKFVMFKTTDFRSEWYDPQWGDKDPDVEIEINTIEELFALMEKENMQQAVIGKEDWVKKMPFIELYNGYRE